MLNAEPPIWDRQIRILAEFNDKYELKLRTDPDSADPSGPYVGVPPITERAAFARLRELPEDLPLRTPMLRWAYRLTDARVNAATRLQIARYWRSESVHIESPLRTSTTRSNLLIQALSDSRGRSYWLSALQNQLDRAAEVTSDLWQRREELAKRGGFQGLSSVLDPIADMGALIDKWVALSADNDSDRWPPEMSVLIDLTLANDAGRGWPARISAQSIAGLLGESAWTRNMSLREPEWPRLIGPTSYLRAIHCLGQELARAWAPVSHPFVIANEPWRLSEYKLGWLLASIAINENWQRHVLRLRRDHARSQTRALARSVIQTSRNLCLKLQLRNAAAESAGALRSAFLEGAVSVLGFELPEVFAGQLPRIKFDDAQHLLGLWLGLSDQVGLIQDYDEDWYRNPRAIETVFGQISEVNGLPPARRLIEKDLPIAAKWLKARLDC